MTFVAMGMGVVAAMAGGCIGSSNGDPAESQTSGAISVALAGAPAGIDCINFVFVDEDGTTAAFARAIPTNDFVTIDQLATGAYDLTATAFGNGLAQPVTDAQCQMVPPTAPWTTESPVPVVIQQGVAAFAQIKLVAGGGAVVGATFVATPQVIAQGQGAVGQIAANGTVAAWQTAAAGSGGTIVMLDTSSGAGPAVIASGQSEPSEIVIDLATDNVFWTNYWSGARDADGNQINDGSVWAYTGGAATAIETGITPSDIQVAGNGVAYWGNESFAPGSIDCSACAGPFATVGGPNAVTAHGAFVYWDDSNTSAIDGQNVTATAASQLASIPPRIPYAFSADDANVYYADYDPTNADPNQYVWSLPAGGGTPVRLATLATQTYEFPIIAHGGYVYYCDQSAVGRVAIDGSSQDALVAGVIGGCAVTSDGAGHDWLYWTDATHGGLVWAGQLD